MTKLSPGGEDDDVIWRGDWLVVRAVRRGNGRAPALDWIESVRRENKKGYGQLLAVCSLVETTLRSGRPPAGRMESVKTSTTGLQELKVTKPGSTPPHLRALFVRVGRTLWVAGGFTKKSDELSPQEIAAADKIITEWKQREAT